MNFRMSKYFSKTLWEPLWTRTSQWSTANTINIYITHFESVKGAERSVLFDVSYIMSCYA
jgi:hypothetical protein